MPRPRASGWIVAAAVERGLAADADAAGLRAQQPGQGASSVLLPQPDGPSRASTVPAGTSRSTPSSTVWPL